MVNLHDPPPNARDAQELRAQIRKLILMKETGPKSAAWHRARVQTIWRLQRKLATITSSTAEHTEDRRH